MATEIINNGTQVINSGTQIINSGTQIISNVSASTEKSFIGGFLQRNENISGWSILKKINVQSGEADLYIADKNGQKAVIKYYHGNIHPKKDLLDKLLKLNHPDIINIYEYGEYKGHFYEIMDYAAGGALDSKNEDGTYKYLPLSEDKVIQVCKEVINSFKTCHEKGIIHRDIKPANIYYKNADGSDIVIGDFGISSLFNEDEIINHKTTTASRTTGYAAPEVLSGIISSKMDYYALGITLWEISTGQDPFLLPSGKRRNDAHLIRDTIEGRIADDLLSREPELSEKMQRLIRGLLVIDPDKRWGHEEVVKHLNGENVPVYVREENHWEYELEGQTCTSLEALGNVLVENMNSPNIEKEINRRYLSGFLEDYYPDIAKKIDDIVEEYPTDKNNLAIQLIIWLLNPSIPFITQKGYKASSLEELTELIINAPEEMLPVLKDKSSSFYMFLKHIGHSDMISKIQSIRKDESCDANIMLALYEAAVILKENRIKPFEFLGFTDFSLNNVEQLKNLNHELKGYVIKQIRNRSCEGLIVPWLLQNGLNIEDLNKICDWDDLAFKLEIFDENDIKITQEEENVLNEASEIFYRTGDYDTVVGKLNPIKKRLKYSKQFRDIYGPVYFTGMDSDTFGDDERKLYPLSSIKWILKNNYKNSAFAMSKDSIVVNELIASYEKKYGNCIILNCLKVIYDFLLSNDRLTYNVTDLGKPNNKLELSWQVKTLAIIYTLKMNKSIDFNKEFCDENNLYWNFMNKDI